MLVEYRRDIVLCCLRSAKGKPIGRPHTTIDDISAIFYKHYPAYAAGQINKIELARICKLSRPTVYKCLNLIG